MPLRTAKPGERLSRGVWVLPYMGPNSELVVAAIRGDGRIIGQPVTIPWGTDSVQVVLDLWELLEATDTDGPGLRVIRASGAHPSLP